jgi:cellulose synthase/poly-beta-1,6-N-acetylglucosamine synthase-like glycosyltransferase
MILQTTLIIFLSLYFLLIKKFQLGWNKLQLFTDNHSGSLSIVISARNELSNLPQLIQDLNNQSYPSDLVEIIIIDDNSEDDSFAFLSSVPNVKSYKSSGVGKKHAIAQAISLASNEIIITTDADCRIPKDWLSKMASPFVSKEVQLCVGAVSYNSSNNVFEDMQALEFMSLIGSGAGAIGSNIPFMCNGANLAFRKGIFSATSQEIASGDDVFLLHFIKKNNGKIVFVKEDSSIITTSAKPTFSSFINQRKRWASKSSSYSDKHAIAISFIVFLANMSLLVSVFMGDYVLFLGLLFIKIIADYPFLKKLSVFFWMSHLLRYFWILQLIYPLYIIYVGIVAQLSTFEWKGRKYNK